MSRPLALTLCPMALGILVARWAVGVCPLPSAVRVWMAALAVALAVLGVALVVAYLLSRPRREPFPSTSWQVGLGLRLRRSQTVFVSLLCAFFVVFGMLRQVLYAESLAIQWPEARTHVSGIVASPPQRLGTGVSFRLQTTRPVPAQLVLNCWPAGDSVPSMPQVGEWVEAEAIVRRPRNRGNPDEFDYAGWLWRQDVAGVAETGARQLATSVPTAQQWASLAPMTRLRVSALRLRQRLLTRYAAYGLEGQTLAVVSALTLADRSRLSADTRELYAEAGASHLLALSGLHLGIITGLVMTLLTTRLTASRLRKPLCLVVIGFVWGFAFLTGMPTSLLRASLMTTFCAISLMTGSNASPLHHLGLAAAALLIVSPASLFDAAAQMSVAAAAGVLTIYRRLWKALIKSRWRFRMFALQRWRLSWIPETLLVSFAAQTATLPFVMWYFHQVPLYAPLFSILLIPLTMATIYAAAALLILGGLSSGLTAALAWVVAALVGVQLWVMQLAASLPGAVVKDFWSHGARPQVVVYHNRRCPALHVIASPGRSWMLMPWPERADSGMAHIRRTFWQRRLTSAPECLRGRHALAVGGFRGVMLSGPAGVAPTADAGGREAVDVLWLCGDFRGRLATTAVEPQLVVLDASLPRHLRERLRREASHLGWAIYDVGESGALTLPLRTAGSPPGRRRAESGWDSSDRPGRQ